MEFELAGGSQETLAQAQNTIKRQQQEIERLRRLLIDERFAEDLRRALTLASTASAIASPVSHARLLEMIVETAADVIPSRAASLFLVDEKKENLVFEVAVGPKAEEVKKFRLPLGQGIAGLVAVSGQPMAISDAGSEPRQAADIARSVDYMPQTILCGPLFYHDETIGVLELLDRKEAPSFSARDMETLGLFANQAAVAIEQSRVAGNLLALLTEVLKSSDGMLDDQRQGLQERARTFADHLEEDTEFRKALDIASLVQEIANQGENELRGCQTILRGFAEYLRSQPVVEPGTTR